MVDIDTKTAHFDTKMADIATEIVDSNTKMTDMYVATRMMTDAFRTRK